MNKLKCACLCGLVGILFFAISIVVSVVANPANAPFKAAVDYIPERTEIVLGEPLYVTFSVTNKGFRPFYLETGGDFRMAIRPGRFSFKAVDSSGVAAKDSYPDAHNYGGPLFFPEIKPHSTYSEKLFLPLWIKFDHSGRYRVHAERSLQLYTSPNPLRPAAVTNSGTFDFYVTVLPANSNLLGKRIQQLGEQTKIPEPAYNAAWALAYIDDDRVIPYLVYCVETYKGDALYPAIEGLGRHPSAESARALIKLLDNPNYYYGQHEVISALAKMKSSEAKGVLRESLNSPSAFTRSAVAKFLGQMSDRDSINSMKEHLKDLNPEVRLACAKALVWMNAFKTGSNSPVMLAQILDTKNPSVTNSYNHDLFYLIAAVDGPRLSYNFSFTGETTEEEILENKKALAMMQNWANSSNSIPTH